MAEIEREYETAGRFVAAYLGNLKTKGIVGWFDFHYQTIEPLMHCERDLAHEAFMRGYRSGTESMPTKETILARLRTINESVKIIIESNRMSSAITLAMSDLLIKLINAVEEEERD